MNPSVMKSAFIEAGKQNLPVSVYIPGKVFIEAKDVEHGKVVYSVITNFARPEIGGFTAFYEDIFHPLIYRFHESVTLTATLIDNSGEVLHLQKS